MSFIIKLRIIVAMAAGLIFTTTQVNAQAQGYFGLSVTSSTDSLFVSNALTYVITLTNLVGAVQDVVVSNALPASAQFVSAIPSFGGSVTNYGNAVVFDTGGFDYGSVVQMQFTVQPMAVGFFTNFVIVYVPSTLVTNTAATNVVTQVTNTVPPQVNLGVTIRVPTNAVIVNDVTTYTVSVTNAGPNAAPDVVLTNTLPSGVIFKNVSPSNQTYTVASNNLILNLGPLTNGGFKIFQFTIQPTNAGLLNLFASASAPGVLDTNNNNSASNSISVINYLPGNLVAVTNSAQIINPQNGLIEQSILVSNVGTNDVPSVRVVVTGLTNRLVNTSGTNSGSPFVVYAAPLAVGQNVTLLLQYAPRKNFPFTNSQLHAFAVPRPDLTPPVAGLGTNVTITRFVMLPNGNTLVEFSSVLGRTYTIVYSDSLSFSNAMIAPPSITAPANLVQWIDYGPPATVSKPSSGSSRFYRVFLNP